MDIYTVAERIIGSFSKGAVGVGEGKGVLAVMFDYPHELNALAGSQAKDQTCLEAL